MTEETRLKQDLLNLANNLDYAKGLIIIKGINTGETADLDMAYHKLNPILAIPALLATLADVYGTALSDMEFGLAKGEFSKEELKEMDATISNMILKFNSLTKDLYEESLERRQIILTKDIGSNQVEKEEK